MQQSTHSVPLALMQWEDGPWSRSPCPETMPRCKTRHRAPGKDLSAWPHRQLPCCVLPGMGETINIYYLLSRLPKPFHSAF